MDNNSTLKLEVVTGIFPLLMFIAGNRFSYKNNKIKEQQRELEENKVIIKTFKKMQEAEAKAPTDKQSLLQSLSKGDF